MERISPYRIPDCDRYRYVKVLYIRYPPPLLFHLLEHWIGWHPCIAAEA